MQLTERWITTGEQKTIFVVDRLGSPIFQNRTALFIFKSKIARRQLNYEKNRNYYGQRQ